MYFCDPLHKEVKNHAGEGKAVTLMKNLFLTSLLRVNDLRPSDSMEKDVTKNSVLR